MFALSEGHLSTPLLNDPVYVSIFGEEVAYLVPPHVFVYRLIPGGVLVRGQRLAVANGVDTICLGAKCLAAIDSSTAGLWIHDRAESPVMPLRSKLSTLAPVTTVSWFEDNTLMGGTADGCVLLGSHAPVKVNASRVLALASIPEKGTLCAVTETGAFLLTTGSMTVTHIGKRWYHEPEECGGCASSERDAYFVSRPGQKVWKVHPQSGVILSTITLSTLTIGRPEWETLPRMCAGPGSQVMVWSPRHRDVLVVNTDKASSTGFTVAADICWIRCIEESFVIILCDLTRFQLCTRELCPIPPVESDLDMAMLTVPTGELLKEFLWWAVDKVEKASPQISDATKSFTRLLAAQVVDTASPRLAEPSPAPSIETIDTTTAVSRTSSLLTVDNEEEVMGNESFPRDSDISPMPLTKSGSKKKIVRKVVKAPKAAVILQPQRDASEGRHVNAPSVILSEKELVSLRTDIGEVPSLDDMSRTIREHREELERDVARREALERMEILLEKERRTFLDSEEAPRREIVVGEATDRDVVATFFAFESILVNERDVARRQALERTEMLLEKERCKLVDSEEALRRDIFVAESMDRNLLAHMFETESVLGIESLVEDISENSLLSLLCPHPVRGEANAVNEIAEVPGSPDEDPSSGIVTSAPERRPHPLLGIIHDAAAVRRYALSPCNDSDPLRGPLCEVVRRLREEEQSVDCDRTVEYFENESRLSSTTAWVPGQPRSLLAVEFPPTTNFEGEKISRQSLTVLPGMSWCWVKDWEADPWIHATNWTSHEWNKIETASHYVRRRRWHRSMVNPPACFKREDLLAVHDAEIVQFATALLGSAMEGK